MEECKFKEVEHPLFGKIITTTDTDGKTLYKAAQVAKAIGFTHYGQRLNGRTAFEVVTMRVRNPLGYIVRQKVRFVSEKGVREMIETLGRLETRSVQTKQKRYMKLLQQ